MERRRVVVLAGVAAAAAVAVMIVAAAAAAARRRRRFRRGWDDDGTKTVLCYGDSNTFGYDAFSEASGLAEPRYDSSTRWPRKMAHALGPGYAVIEEGRNGRTTVLDDVVPNAMKHPTLPGAYLNGRTTLGPVLRHHASALAPKRLDLVILMLGTNDLKARLKQKPEHIARGAAALVEDAAQLVAGGTRRVLLVAPPIVWDKSDWGFVDARRRSILCAPHFQVQAERLGCAYMDAGAIVAIPDPSRRGGDGIHFAPENHHVLGTALAVKVREILTEGSSESSSSPDECFPKTPT